MAVSQDRNTCHIRVLYRTKAFTAPCTAGLPWIFAGERHNLCPINSLPTFGCSVREIPFRQLRLFSPVLELTDIAVRCPLL